MKSWLNRLLLVTVGAPIAAGSAAALAFLITHRTNGSLVSSRERRKYLLFVPKRYDPAAAHPLVISMHGFAEWPAHQAQTSRWHELAEREGFIVVYPRGTGFPLRWRTFDWPGGGVNLEVRFISDLIAHLESQYNIDPRRIYANGLSNGGGMTYALSCRLSDRIAAVGMVSGAYLMNPQACHPDRPTPAMIFHGTADRIVPYHGGTSRSFQLPFPDIPTWVEGLARRNGCVLEPETLPASGAVSGVRYPGEADVVFYTIAGGGHGWPGGVPIPEFIVGHTCQEIDATARMWEFFQKHPLAEK